MEPLAHIKMQVLVSSMTVVLHSEKQQAPLDIAISILNICIIYTFHSTNEFIFLITRSLFMFVNLQD